MPEGDDQVITGQGSDVVDGGSGNDIIYLEADGIWSSRFAAARFATKLDGTSFLAEKVSLGGKNRFFDVVDGNADFDTIVLTNADRGDAFFLHDFFSDFNGGLSNGFVIDDQGMSGTTRMSG